MAGRLVLLLLAFLFLPGCAYLQDRGMDFLDQFRGSVGVGTNVGLRARSLGLWDTGVMVGMKPRASALGWKYGTPLFFNTRDERLDADQAELIKTTSLLGYRMTDGSYDSARSSFALLPVLFTWTDATPRDFKWDVPETGEDFKDRSWLWTGRASENSRWSRIHAFDLEYEIAIFVYLDLGYSPGETLDFLLGIFTIDIAKDDGRFRKRK